MPSAIQDIALPPSENQVEDVKPFEVINLKMNNLEELKSLLLESNLLNFYHLEDETIDEMLDNRDDAEFETDWLRIFHKLENKTFSAENLAAI